MLAMVMQMLPVAVAVFYVGASYLVVTLDRSRPTSPSKDDTQVGIKLIIWAFVIAGLGFAAGGVDAILSYALGGFRGGSLPLRAALGPLVVGAGITVVFGIVLLGKTNNATHKQPERYALGVIGLYFGILALVEITQVISAVFVAASWGEISSGFAGSLVHGALGILAIVMLGGRSGWTGPTPPRLPNQGYPPPQQGGYPPPQGNYPPPQGGYTPGGYNPQGGGYPPQGGGGYPPA